MEQIKTWRLFFVCCLITVSAAAQQFVLSGVVRDASGEELPYVSIYIEGTGRGTASNSDGAYSIMVSPGQSLVYQFIGYEKRKITVSAGKTELNVIMQEQVLTIPEVELVAGDEDPAYPIIRAAIKKRKYYLDQVGSYGGDLYIKGVASFDEFPEKLPFFIGKDEVPDSTDLGIIYLSESITKFHYQKPGDFKEEMIASKISGWNQITSFNRAEQVQFNFYENQIDFDGLSDRGFVSPISGSAMFYYRYKLLGSFYQDGSLVYKIDVRPKRKTDPCFQGEIYIVDDSWRIHSLDLFLTKDTPIQFVDTLRLEQSYIAVKDDIWLPLSTKIHEDIRILGFSIGAQFTGVFSNYTVNQAYDDTFFGNEVFTVNEEASKKDSLFWEENRPVLLTKVEKEDYVKGDSLMEVRESDVYKDSLDTRYNKVGLMDIVLHGGSYTKRKKRFRVNYNSLIKGLAFNPVEGWNETLSLSYTKWYDRDISKKWYRLESKMRYGFSDEEFKLNLFGVYKPDQRHIKSYFGGLGSYVAQFNRDKPIDPLVNSAYALLDKSNFIKLYHREYLMGGYQNELINGLYFSAYLNYESRKSLENTTDFSWSKSDDVYEDNNPVPFEAHNALIASAKLVYRHRQKYETTAQGKRVIGSKYPSLYMEYKKGVNALGSDVDYDFIKLGIDDNFKSGLLGITAYNVVYGKFINNSKTSFADYQHFNGNETSLIRNIGFSSPFDGSGLTYFHTLPYYSYSTNTSYMQAHVEHHFNGFLINKIPFLRKTKFQTVAGVNYLNTEEAVAFTELFFGIENIFKVLRVDFASSYTEGEKWKPQVRFGLSIGF